MPPSTPLLERITVPTQGSSLSETRHSWKADLRPCCKKAYKQLARKEALRQRNLRRHSNSLLRRPSLRVYGATSHPWRGCGLRKPVPLVRRRCSTAAVRRHGCTTLLLFRTDIVLLISPGRPLRQCPDTHAGPRTQLSQLTARSHNQAFVAQKC